MKFDPYTMKPTTIDEYKVVVQMGTDPDAELPDDLYSDDMFGSEDHLTITDVLAAHREVGRLSHDMVKLAMGPNWPEDWSETTEIFEPRECFDCGTTGQCHMNCGPALPVNSSRDDGGSKVR